MSIENIARKFKVREVLPDDAWYLEITNDLRVMIVTNKVMEFDPIVKINNISEELFSVETELGRSYDLDFRNLQLINAPTIRAIRCISGILQPAQSEPILLALYDLSGVVYREVLRFGAEPLEPEGIVRDYYDVCEVKDKKILLSAARYILKSQK